MQSIGKNKRFLIIRLSSFGDVLLTTPVIRALQKNDPKVSIHFLVRKPFHQMIENNRELKLHFYDKNDPSFIHDLQKINFDLVIDLQNNAKSHSLIRKLSYKKKVSYNKERIKRFLFIQFRIKLYNKKRRTVPERYLESLSDFKIKTDGFLPHYHLQQNKPFTHFNAENEHYICIAAGAAHATKQWPKEYFSQLIEKLLPKYKLVLLGGEKERETADYLMQASKGLIDFVGKTNFNQSAYLLKYAQALVCNDSSIMHLATALRKKTLVFLGSTSEIFGFCLPHDDLRILQNRDISCRPCSHIGKKKCPKKHFNCMKTLDVDRAFETLNALLEKNS